MKENSTLRVNTLSIELKEEERERSFLFWREKQRDRIPLKKRDYPKSFVARNPKTAEECEYLYADPASGAGTLSDTSKGEPYAITLSLEEAFGFARHYLHHRLARLLRPYADYIGRDFIHTPELWFRTPEMDEGSLEAYRKFRVKIVKKWYTEGLGLSVKYSGVSFRYPHAVIGEDERVKTTDLTRVLYKGYQFHYEAIPEDKRDDIDFTQLYPVVNHNIRKILNQYPTPDPNKNRVKEYVEQINWFKENVLEREEIAESLPFEIAENDWSEIPGESAHNIEKKASLMTFRTGEKDINPYTGMNNYGPRKPAPGNHYRFIYIMAERDKTGVGRKLHRYMKGEVKGVPGLFQFANIAGDFSGGFIGFENEDDPLPEVIEGLNNLEKKPGVKDFAIYITPFDKYEQDPRKRRVYYRVKEELLKRKIVSQVVERPTIRNANFRYVMPNIAVAALAKLGGVPWQLAEPPGRDLIVGVGAFKPREFSRRYLGSAFCFRSNGTFKGLRCFTDDEPRMLAGSIREAVTEYVTEHGEAERLVIHFYKTMSYRERKPIMEMLRSLGLDIPVVVLTINKTEYEETLLFDEDHPQLIPISGTYFYRSRNDILLCNNTRYGTGDRIKRGFHFPIRVQMWASDDDLLSDGKTRHELVRQVYQFSRLYWKSVSQISVPVTIKYPGMVAKMFPYFENLTLPTLGRKSLWFL